ncbi:MAG: tandem-95 repeat protein [Desulfobacteraceae bacterium]|nr:tandem-95 repeat protein [Desulfobacteraceae bacterium]
MSIRRISFFLLLATFLVAAAIPINPNIGTVYSISGRVVDNNGTPLEGVVLNGLLTDPTDASGDYSAYLEEGWSGTVTPTLDGYTFDPYRRNYNNVDSDLVDQDYTAYQIPDITTPNIIVGRNVNMVPYPDIGLDGKPVVDTGDPYLQRQNEPSIAVSTRNPMHLLAAANDYRTVNEPFSEGPLPGIDLKAQASGDAWLGIYKSYNGGQSWKATLLPGYPQDGTTIGLTSPLKDYSTACDPTVRAGASGLFFTSGIAFNRTKNGTSAIIVARYIDNNTQAMGHMDHMDSIKYLGVNIIDKGTSGQFADKPWIAVDAPRNSGDPVMIEHPGFADQPIPRFNVYIVYSIFLGDSPSGDHSKIMFAKSTDCGKNFGKTIKLSEDVHVCQGTNIAVSPLDGTIYVVWRQYAHEEEGVPHAIVMCKSEDFGQTFTKATVVAEINPFDQFTSVLEGAKRFRTSAFPALAVDHHGLVYVAWSQRGEGPDGCARIVIKTSMDGQNWAEQTYDPVDDHEGGGHQFMPSLTCAGGILRMTWYDARKSLGYLDQEGDYHHHDEITDPGPTGMLHTIDAWVAQAELPNPSQNPNNPVFTDSTQVSRYLYEVETDDNGHVTDPPVVYQAQYNFPNFPLFMEGEAPFMGDYLDITPAPMFLYDDLNSWRFNTGEGEFDPTLSYITFACNRDVIPPREGYTWKDYWPPGSDACDVWTAGLRNQNIYSAPVTQGIQVGCPVNTKPLGGDRRSFLVFVKNLTDENKLIRLTIDAPNLNASFWEAVTPPVVEYPFERCENTIVEVHVFPHSSITLTVFVLPYEPIPNPLATFRVNVDEIDGHLGNPTNPDLKNSVVLNPDPVNTQLIPSLAVEDHTPFVIIEDPVDVLLSDATMLSAPIVYYPYLEELLNSSNPDIAAPGLRHPGLRHNTIINPGLRHTNIGDMPQGETTDLNWTVTNAGSTTSAYSFDAIADPPPVPYQLLIYRVATTPISAEECQLRAEEHHELLLSVQNPGLRHPGLRHPGLRHPGLRHNTFFLAPGETAICTLRLIDDDPPPESGGITQEAGILSTEETQDDFNPEDYATTVAGAAIPQAANEFGYIEVDSSLYIIARDLPQGLVNEKYQDTDLEAFGGIPDYVQNEGTPDPDDDIWIYSGWNGDLPDGLFLESDGRIWGTPEDDPLVTYPHTYSFTVELLDASDPRQLARRTFSIEIISPNTAPVAENDEYSVNEDNTLNVSAAAGVLVNDDDADDDLLSASLETDPSHGTLTLNSDGSFTYTPDTNFNGSDSFTYTASDGKGGMDTATATITVNPVNDTPQVSDIPNQTIDEGAAFTTINLDDYVEDVDNSDGEISWTYSGTTELMVSIDASRIATISIPNVNWNGSEIITFTATDQASASNFDSATFTVIAINDPPTISGTTPTTVSEDSPYSFVPVASDVEEDPLTFSITNKPSWATFSTDTGELSGSPTNDDVGTTTGIVITVSDDDLFESLAAFDLTVTNVNDPPTAADDSFSVDEDTPLSVAAPGVLLNDTDVDPTEDTLYANLESDVFSGSLTLNSDGSFDYIPNQNFNGIDSFTYLANDGTANSATAAKVLITINPVNDPPKNTDPPSIEGNAYLGETLTAEEGSWNDETDMIPGILSYSYKWQRADDESEPNPVYIDGATNKNYTTTVNDINKYVRVEITATDDGEGVPFQSTSAVSSYIFIPSPTYTISGTVTVGGSPLPGVEMTGLPNNPTTDNSGSYTGTVNYGYSGIVTPTKAGYAFDPTNRNYSNPPVTSNKLDEDYIALAKVQEWVKTYNKSPENGDDAATAIAVNNSGNVFVTGYSSNVTDDDYATIMYAPDGSKPWSTNPDLYDGVARYNSGGDDHATAIAVGDSENVYVTGYSIKKETGSGEDFLTIKYDRLGNEVWTARYDGPSHLGDRPSAIAVDSEENVYVTGYSYRGNKKQHADYYTVKYDSAGKLIWDVQYDARNNGNDMATAIAVGATGVYVTGRSELDLGGSAELHYDYYTVKYDATRGTEIWDARYNGPGNGVDEATDIAILKDSFGNDINIYVTGKSYGGDLSTGVTGFDYATIKYNPINGNPEWSGEGIHLGAVRYNGSGNGNDAATAIAANSSGVYVTGYSSNGTDNDYATIKYNPINGTPAWSGDAVTYNGPGNGNDEATAIALDSSGVYVTGKSQGNGTNYDCYTVKYESSGNVVWFATYNSLGNGDDEAAAIAVNSSGVYVTGRSDGFGTGFDYVTIKYIQ